VKGRLLYYYPTDDTGDDSWIGWHNDSGFLTTLTSAQFYDDVAGKVRLPLKSPRLPSFDDPVLQVIQNPDPNGGLWIVDRDSSAVNVKIPADHLAIQCGECLQVVTGGTCSPSPPLSVWT